MRIAFLTGTRADFGKIKTLIKVVHEHPGFQYHVFVTGMHMLDEYGFTALEVKKSGFQNLHHFDNHTSEKTMDLSLAKTIDGFSRFTKEVQPDLIIVHGDRIETLAGAIVGCLNNILVAHIEGGEVSGTVDELIRHSVSKLSHLHFVSNDEAKRRLIQMGEVPDSIHVIGSPDIDIMFSSQLPELNSVKEYYEIPFEPYAIGMLHPVTNDPNETKETIQPYIEAMMESAYSYILVYPNNDLGSSLIIDAIKPLADHHRFRVIPSLRFEYFLVLLKHAQFLIGNSSAGIHEAPVYGVPSVNIGSRQMNRSNHPLIRHCASDKQAILTSIQEVTSEQAVSGVQHSHFGEGKSAELFLNWLTSTDLKALNPQKQFVDL